jgi:hypothetical protein
MILIGFFLANILLSFSGDHLPFTLDYLILLN